MGHPMGQVAHNKQLLAAMAAQAAAQGGGRVLTPRFPQDFWMGHPDLAPPNMVTGLPTGIGQYQFIFILMEKYWNSLEYQLVIVIDPT